MLIQKFVEVPNTIIREPVLNDFGYDLCYDLAQQYGHAQSGGGRVHGQGLTHSCVREYSSGWGVAPAPRLLKWQGTIKL